MRYGQVIAIFKETNLSPESLAEWIGISNSTYRRWQKEPQKAKLPQEYRQNIMTGIFNLLSDNKLSYESAKVTRIIEQNIPTFFDAAASQLGRSDALFTKDSSHHDKVTAILCNLGSNMKTQLRVDKAKPQIRKFQNWGGEWKHRIQILLRVLADKELTVVDRLVSYGALFYLILPFDLIPDAIPVFGYVDDFGILGFATAYYANRFSRFKK